MSRLRASKDDGPFFVEPEYEDVPEREDDQDDVGRQKVIVAPRSDGAITIFPARLHGSEPVIPTNPGPSSQLARELVDALAAAVSAAEDLTLHQDVGKPLWGATDAVRGTS